MICRICKLEKDISLFEVKSGKHTTRCLDCKNKYQREYYSRSGNREKQRKRVADYKINNPHRNRATRYGLTTAEVADILGRQCGICENRVVEVIDHDHISGQVRGGLCQTCNTGLGKLGDTVESLQKAIAYLQAPRVAGGHK